MILTLHNAVEHSLVVHLATSGTNSTSIHSEEDEENDREKTISIPNLITYTNLRPIVENSCGRRFGINEFKRLVAVWEEEDQENKLATSLSEEKDELRGLGFIINKVRSLDSNGKRALDWGVGIELKVKFPPKRPVTPPIQVSFGSAPNTPPTKPNSAQDSPGLSFGEGFGSPSGKSRGNPNGSTGREGMSIIALWHNGIEYRKSEVARRLSERCGRIHQAWLEDKSNVQDGVSTPSKKGKEREVLSGEGGLLTPANTRENGRRKRGRVVHFEIDSQEDEEEDEDGDITLMPSSDLDFETSLRLNRSSPPGSPVKRKGLPNSKEEGEEITSWHPSFNLNQVSQLPFANLPSLKESLKNNSSTSNLSRSVADQMSSLRQQSSNGTSSSEVPSTPTSSKNGKLSLVERIKAKEDAKKLQLEKIQAQRFGNVKSFTSSKNLKQLEMETQSTLMKGYKRRSILSRLSDVADAIYMLFTTNLSTSSPISNTRRYSPTISISEILNTITKSSKVSLSRVEAKEALDLLCEISPGFLELIQVGDREWAKLGEGKMLINVTKLNLEGVKGIGLRECKVRIARELVAPGAGRNQE